jgi:hypothetical protein
MALPEDIIEKVRQDFSEDDSLFVLQTFKKLVSGDSKLFSDRILRCLVVLACGDADKLLKGIAAVRLDWRDVISAAEYDWGNHARLLGFPFGFHPDLETFKQWFVGHEINIPWADNEKWKIKSADIRSLSLVEVKQLKNVNAKISNPNLYVTRINFLCIRGNKEISVSKAMDGEIVICYRVDPTIGNFEFRQFKYSQKKIGKRGKW